MTGISWLRYVRHVDVAAYQAEGWVIASNLGPTHGAYAVLCEYPELWRPLAGYEGVYEVSSHGRVRSLDRVLHKPNAKNGYPRRVKGQVIVTSPAKDGYLMAPLSNAAGVKSRRHVAHLVLETFKGPRPPGLFACHNDGVVTNNAGFNLRWDTRANNEADKLEHGTLLQGERCPASKLTESDVRHIRASRHLVPQAELAAHYGVTQSNISIIQSGATWKTVKGASA